jgi:hypothetical protein
VIATVFIVLMITQDFVLADDLFVNGSLTLGTTTTFFFGASDIISSSVHVWQMW